MSTDMTGQSPRLYDNAAGDVSISITKQNDQIQVSEIEKTPLWMHRIPHFLSKKFLPPIPFRLFDTEQNQVTHYIVK